MSVARELVGIVTLAVVAELEATATLAEDGIVRGYVQGYTPDLAAIGAGLKVSRFVSRDRSASPLQNSSARSLAQVTGSPTLATKAIPATRTTAATTMPPSFGETRIRGSNLTAISPMTAAIASLEEARRARRVQLVNRTLQVGAGSPGVEERVCVDDCQRRRNRREDEPRERGRRSLAVRT